MAQDENRYFLTARADADLVIGEIEGKPLHQQYERFVAELSQVIGSKAVRLFAKPDVSVSKVSGQRTVSWYSWLDSTPRQITDLNEAERTIVEKRLREQVALLREAAQASDFLKSYLEAALNVSGPADLLELELNPVLINWGMLYPKDYLSAASHKTHSDETIGAYLPGDINPTREAFLQSSASEQSEASQIDGPDVEIDIEVNVEEGEGAGQAESSNTSEQETSDKTDSGSGQDTRGRSAGLQSGGSAAGAVFTDAASASAAQSGSVDAEAGLSAGGDAAQAHSGDGGGVSGPGTAVIEDRSPFWRSCWFFPLIALALAMLALLYALWPGNLVYPDSYGSAGSQSAMLDEAERALRDRVQVLRDALDNNGDEQCSIDPAILRQPLTRPPLLPGSLPAIEGDDPAAPPQGIQGATPGTRNADDEGGNSGTSGEQGAQDGNAAEPLSENGNAVEQRAEEASPPASPAETSQARLSLLELMDQGTVLIVSNGGDGSSSLGTGFFIDQRRILTNNHVVENAGNRRVLVSNKKIGSMFATVVAASNGSEIGKDDFALLELEQAQDITPLQLTTESNRLDPIIAAGFPGFVINGDAAFQQASSGDTSALSNVQLVVTRGNIITVQNAGNGRILISHSAQISPGNSGGPLLDECGRVAGINTFVKNDSQLSINLNVAHPVQSILRFLESSGVNAEASSQVCRPSQPQAEAR